MSSVEEETPSSPAEGAHRPTVATSRVPLLEVSGGPGRLSANTFRELWVFREVLWAFLLRHVKVKYKQTAIGVLWAVIQPLIAAALLTVFIGRLAHIPSEGVPYLAFAMAGMTVWSYFSTAAGTAMDSLIADQGMIRKVYFPREALPLSAIGAALADLMFALLAFLAVALFSGIGPSVTWLWLPLPVLVLVVAAAAFGLGIAGPNVYYRDVRHALPYVIQLGLIASPIIYPLERVPAGWRTPYAIMNPVAASIDAIRRSVLHHTSPDLGVTLGALVWSVILLTGAYVLFKRMERGFADRV